MSNTQQDTWTLQTTSENARKRWRTEAKQQINRRFVMISVFDSKLRFFFCARRNDYHYINSLSWLFCAVVIPKTWIYFDFITYSYSVKSSVRFTQYEMWLSWFLYALGNHLVSNRQRHFYPGKKKADTLVRITDVFSCAHTFTSFYSSGILELPKKCTPHTRSTASLGSHISNGLRKTKVKTRKGKTQRSRVS